MATAAMTQMNVRLERTLKEEGDAALASIGLTPTEVVRAIWEKLARRGEDLEEVRRLVMPTPKEVDPVVAARLAAFERGKSIVPDGLRELGVSPSTLLAVGEATDEDLRYEGIVERMRERGTWE